MILHAGPNEFVEFEYQGQVRRITRVRAYVDAVPDMDTTGPDWPRTYLVDTEDGWSCLVKTGDAYHKPESEVFIVAIEEPVNAA